MTPLVTVRQLHKVYKRGAEQVDVLQGVNLDQGRLIEDAAA